MILEGFFGSEKLMASRTGVGEGVWKMLAFYMNSHVGLGRMGEGKADATSGNPDLIECDVFVEIRVP